jgi:hypothetical protein
MMNASGEGNGVKPKVDLGLACCTIGIVFSTAAAVSFNDGHMAAGAWLSVIATITFAVAVRYWRSM